MVYFLALLAVALLAASLLVYQNAEQTLEAKQQAMEKLIDAQYNARTTEEKARLDEALLFQAQSLAHVVQVQIDHYRAERIQPLFLLGLLSSSPNNHLLAPTWIAEGAPPVFEPPPRTTQSGGTPSRGRPQWQPYSPVYLEFRSRFLSSVKLKQNELVLPGDGLVGEYYQIDYPPGPSYHSNSMNGRSFPLDPASFSPDQLIQWRCDDTTLEPGKPVHRVVLKASGVTMASIRPPPPQRTPSPSGSRETTRRDYSYHEYPGQTIYVHCAAETDKQDAALKLLSDQHDEELAEVAAQTKASLDDLRVWLLAISLAVFAATGIGGFWLVRLGLSPLRRLSDAVSRVSAKDFRLPLGERPLPGELQPIAKRLSSTLDLLKRTFAREKQAVADISHELRTPLAALMTTTEFALRKPRSPEQYRELLGDCLNSAQQMNQIVERLLTLARLDAGVDRLRVQSVDAAALAQQCAAVVRPLAEARGLKLLVKCPADAEVEDGDSTCVVQTDGDKLREIVTNLLHNAIQYNRPGGSVALRLARENGTLDVEVEDTGIGMTAETREHIFERFYRADSSRGGDDLHAGLGLAIVKEYIDLMGGSIGVESTVGQGSTFRVHLPVR
jgi:heavy metal sensor kinase